MSRLSNTWSLMKSSFAVLRQDKKILIFPLLSGLVTLVILLTFFLPVFFAESYLIADLFEGSADPVAIALIFLFYFVNYFFVLFFNSAAVAYAIDHMRGGSPSVWGAVQKVKSRWLALLGWTAIAATIGLILNSIENQSDKIGKIVIAMLGLSWTVISFLVLPILIIEGKGPIESLKESAAMLKKVWAEQLIGHFSFGLIFGLLILPVVLVAIPIILLDGLFIYLALFIVLIFSILLGIVQWVLQSIFMGTVYLYVRDHQVPDCFSLSQINEAMH
jgi:hypothetical protein